MRKYSRVIFYFPLFFILISARSIVAAPAPNWQVKVDSRVIKAASSGETEYLVFLNQQADLDKAKQLASKQEKGEFVVNRLKSTAENSQKSILDFLTSGGVEHRSFWIANLIWVQSDYEILTAVARRSDTAKIYSDQNFALKFPETELAPELSSRLLSPGGIEWNITKINAPVVWDAGFTGSGVVIGGQDTGYEWEHPALKSKYRGWDGSAVDHNYNWHDAIHTGGGICGPDSPEPCDDYWHGTHTMGTIVGDDGAGAQIGVAPSAKWIGCRNMDQGDGKASTYIECFQWFVEPTDLNGKNGNPALAPHVINNSWYCPPQEECAWDSLQEVIDNTRAAGIVVVTSAGNDGYKGCGTVSYPPAIYESSFSIGATDQNDNIASFSSRGPSDFTNLLKPNVTAPGVGIYSSTLDGAYRIASGTSMAAPHVSGLAALLISARPELAGQVEQIETLIEQNALPLTSTENCGGVSGELIPNNTYGWGRIDAMETLFEDIFLPLSSK